MKVKIKLKKEGKRIFGLKVVMRDKVASDSSPKSAAGTKISRITIVPFVSKTTFKYNKRKN